MEQNEFSFDGETRDEGAYEFQLSLPLPSVAAPEPFQVVVKRDGREEAFDRKKIAEAIYRAAQSIGGQDSDLAQSLANGVAIYLLKRMGGATPHVDHVHDAVERVLIHMSHARTALAYARYRDRRARIRRLREGDMGLLLGELEEARLERESLGGLGEKSLFVRTSTDMVTTWDRQRIVEALIRETGLDESLATVVALGVEEQVRQGPITTLTTSLVRELVGAKLVEHGLDEYRERHRRLGVPVYDAARIIRGASADTIAKDPAETSAILAAAVKKEYALTEVFSPAISEAHLRGDFHLHNLGAVDRLATGTGSLGQLASQGIVLSNGERFDAPPENMGQLLAQMMRLGDMLSHITSKGIHWEHMNCYFAPFLVGLEEETIRDAAQMIVYEHAYRALAAGQGHRDRLHLAWTVPSELAGALAFNERDYASLGHQMQRLAWELVDVVRAGGANGSTLPAPAFEATLDAPFWESPGHESFLGALGAAAGAGRVIAFRFARAEEAEKTRAAAPVLHEITLNLPRAALKTGKADAFFRELTGLVELVAKAHEEKALFIDGLLERGSEGPLGLLSHLGRSMPGLDPTRGACHIYVAGLSSAIRCLLGAGPEDSEEAVELGEKILAHLQDMCKKARSRYGLDIWLGAAPDTEAGRRFATLDASQWPKSLHTLLHPGTVDAHYSLGVALWHELALSPFEQARIEGRFHRHLDIAATSPILLPIAELETPAVADLLRKAYFQTSVNAIQFRHNG